MFLISNSTRNLILLLDAGFLVQKDSDGVGGSCDLWLVVGLTFDRHVRCSVLLLFGKTVSNMEFYKATSLTFADCSQGYNFTEGNQRLFAKS